MSTGRESRRAVLASPAGLVAVGFGAGYFPKMPGTVGTLLGIPMFLAMRGAELGRPAEALLAAGLAAVCLPVCSRAERLVGRTDPSCIVCDEYSAFLLVLVLSPDGPAYWVGAFVLFRALDIAKPWPIGAVERRLSGGAAIMADDLVAGLAALCALWAVALAVGAPGG